MLTAQFFGYDQGVFSGILQMEDWLNQFNHPVRFLADSGNELTWKRTTPKLAPSYHAIVWVPWEDVYLTSTPETGSGVVSPCGWQW